MGETRPILAVNFHFVVGELENRIFDPSHYPTGAGPVLRAFREFMAGRGVDVVTLDTVDFNDPAVRYVLYFDYFWREALTDPFLKCIPRQKRVLTMGEPANINPALYYTSLLRDRFHLVFTWDWTLLRRNPAYIRIPVPLAADLSHYRDNPFQERTRRKFLCAVSGNRWSYMPQSTYRLRKRAYRYFENAYPNEFDLFGQLWNTPVVCYEHYLGFPKFASYRGEIAGASDEKIRVMADYKFALCFENNVSQPGYISEKITESLCARCIPVYYGSLGVDEWIPRDAWIDFRDFRNFDALARFLEDIDETRYNRYIAAIDRFMTSDRFSYLSRNHWFEIIADRLFPTNNE